MPVGMTGELIAGRYRMKNRLGAGGMATVFLATDERLERDVAIKRLHADTTDDSGRRFEREAKLGASLNHPSIVSVYDTVTDDDGVLIVMEYVPGHTLRDEIARGPIDPARAIEILCAVASALDNSHQHGVVHRDIKPANVLIDDRAGQVKVADLGIATAAEHSRITQSGSVLGTAPYMAPERLEGGAGNKSVDIYSLAAVAFEMLSGRKPIDGASPLEIARRVASAPPPDLRDHMPDAPAAAAEALKRGLAKRPEDRQASAGELVREISGAYAAQAQPQRTATGNGHGAGRAAPAGAFAEPVGEPAHRPAAAKSNRWIAPAALAAILLVGVIVIALTSGGGSDHQASGGGNAKSKSTASKKNAAAPKTDTSAATPAAPAPAATSTAAATPTDAVSSFYKTSIDDPQGAYERLGSDRLHSQISEADFVSQESTLKAIEFPALSVQSQSGDSASVSFQSVAHHTDKTDHCQGSISVVKGASGWLVDHLDAVNCTHGPA
jgi:eukaryotic-like serine/threonine-protein kinase